MGLNFHPIDPSAPALSYLLLGSFVVFFSMISLLAKHRLYIGESVLATAFGIIIGPHGANLVDPRKWGNGSTTVTFVTLEVMRVTLALGLFAIGVELPQAYLAIHWKSLAFMVIPTMAFGWVISAGFIFWLFPGLTYISCLCISACLTPTDPVLAVAITSGAFAVQHVPINIRRLLAAESASNDGLAYPFLSISIYLSIEASKRQAIGDWFLIGWLYEVIVGTLIGACLGLCFSRFMKFAKRRGFINRETYVIQYVAMTFLTIGLSDLLGTDDLLAAFAAGSAISWDGDFNIETENDIFATVIDLVVNCVAFIYIGAWLPFQSYNIPELNIEPWRLVVLFILILLFRRLPSLILLYKWIPDISDWREAVFAGHFGPMGVGAIFISTLAITRLTEPQLPPQNQEERLAASLHPLVSFVVLGSIIVHGLSIPFIKVGRRTITLTSTWSKTTVKSGRTRTVSPNGSPGDRQEDEVVIGENGVTVALRSRPFDPPERASTLPKPDPVRSFEYNKSPTSTSLPGLPQFFPLAPLSTSTPHSGGNEPAGPNLPTRIDHRNSISPSEPDTISNTVSRTDKSRE